MRVMSAPFGEHVSHHHLCSYHLMVLYVLWFVAFVIACSAMVKANRLDGGAVNHWLSRCESMEYALYRILLRKLSSRIRPRVPGVPGARIFLVNTG